MARAYIVNFTGFFGHWGMYGTSMAIAMALAEKGYDLGFLAVDEIAHHFPADSTWEEMTSPEALGRFETENPETSAAISRSDIVVVNGEGTLHGHRASSLHLLALIVYARKHLKRPVHLINTAIFPTAFQKGIDEDAHRPYMETMRSLAHPVVVRDKTSYRIVKALGGRAILGFDCLPLLIRSLPAPARDASAGRTLVTAAAGCTPAQSKTIARGISQALPEHVSSPSFLSGGTVEYRQFEKRFHAAMRTKIDGLKLIEAEDFCQFCAALRQSTLVSGRFHYLIAGAWTDALLAPFESNTQKNTELMSELGLSTRRLFAPSDDVPRIDRLTRAIKNAASAPVDARLECEQRAVMNFSRIPSVGPPVETSLVKAMAAGLGCRLEDVQRVLG